MSTIRAVDIPELRSELIYWITTQGPTFFDNAIRAGLMPVRPRLPLHEAAQQLATAEVRRLQRADLYWVSAPMAQLAVAAAKSLPSYTLAPEDLPSPDGLLVFEEPVLCPADEIGRTCFVNAVAWGSWQPWTKEWPWPRGGIWISWYADRELNLSYCLEQGLLTDDTVRLAREGLPRLSYDNESQVPFSDTPLGAMSPLTGLPLELAVDEGEEFPRDYIARTAWLLMQQPLSRITQVELDRAAKKRALRAGYEPQAVRIVELRRPVASGSPGESSRAYHHSWIVRGHWRNHWHPKREVHRPVWIAPHVKGPEGAPMIGGEKVYAWKR